MNSCFLYCWSVIAKPARSWVPPSGHGFRPAVLGSARTAVGHCTVSGGGAGSRPVFNAPLCSQHRSPRQPGRPEMPFARRQVMQNLRTLPMPLILRPCRCSQLTMRFQFQLHSSPVRFLRTVDETLMNCYNRLLKIGGVSNSILSSGRFLRFEVQQSSSACNFLHRSAQFRCYF